MITEDFWRIGDIEEMAGNREGRRRCGPRKFVLESLGRRAQQAYNEKIVPALAQRQEAGLRE
jgi:hypothetical protein